MVLAIPSLICIAMAVFAFVAERTESFPIWLRSDSGFFSGVAALFLIPYALVVLIVAAVTKRKALALQALATVGLALVLLVMQAAAFRGGILPH